MWFSSHRKKSLNTQCHVKSHLDTSGKTFIVHITSIVSWKKITREKHYCINYILLNLPPSFLFEEICHGNMQGDYNADLLENVYSMKSWRGGFTCYDVLSNSVLYISICSHCSMNVVSAISITAGECVSVDTHRLRRGVGAPDRSFSWCNR